LAAPHAAGRAFTHAVNGRFNGNYYGGLANAYPCFDAWSIFGSDDFFDGARQQYIALFFQ